MNSMPTWNGKKILNNKIYLAIEINPTSLKAR